MRNRRKSNKTNKQYNSGQAAKTFNKLKNSAMCPIHKKVMTSLVNAYTDDTSVDILHVETFACTIGDCTKQAVTYGGDVDLFNKIKEHYGI